MRENMKSEGEGRGGEQRRKEMMSKNENDRCLSTAYRGEGYVQGEFKKNKQLSKCFLWKLK